MIYNEKSRKCGSNDTLVFGLTDNRSGGVLTPRLHIGSDVRQFPQSVVFINDGWCNQHATL